MNSAALLAQHAKEYGLKPGQQVNVMLTFLTVQTMFPELTLSQFLERAPALYGANDDNRLNPKDALDHWCPTKGSQWPPEKRLVLMTGYADYRAALPAGAPAMTLDQTIAIMLGDATPPPTPVAAPAQADTPVETVDRSVPPMPPVETPPTAAPPVEAPATPAATSSPGQQVPVIPVGSQQFEAVLQLTNEERATANAALASSEPLPSVGLGQAILSTVRDMSSFTLHVDVVNAQPRPFVDIYCRSKTDPGGQPIGELPPQQVAKIEGQYQVLIAGMNSVVQVNIP